MKKDYKVKLDISLPGVGKVDSSDDREYEYKGVFYGADGILLGEAYNPGAGEVLDKFRKGQKQKKQEEDKQKVAASSSPEVMNLLEQFRADLEDVKNQSKDKIEQLQQENKELRARLDSGEGSVATVPNPDDSSEDNSEDNSVVDAQDDSEDINVINGDPTDTDARVELKEGEKLDLKAWAFDTKLYHHAKVRAEIDRLYHRDASTILDMIDVLVEEKVITKEEAEQTEAYKKA